ncbi:MAG: GTPase ObgE [Chloroflexi bacterium]|nr:GTPase ObgE [Chloroflexota bacterium]
MYDRAKITIKSGDGGNGSASFRHEKFVPLGGPDGGDGGRGGNIIFCADNNVTDLLAFKYKKDFKAGCGGNGSSGRSSGKNGADIIISIPVGTIILQENTVGEKEFLADLEQAGQEFLAAMGGNGGQGNQHFATSTNQAPKLAQAGACGEGKTIFLELKILADAAIIGFPNAGKSSLLKAATSAEPKIADYPFTTLSPKLGVVQKDHRRFVLAEIPGLIKDAHQGKGLGYDFLRHIQRNRVLIHLIDAAQEDPLGTMIAVNNELALYDADILNKPQITVLNKADLISDKRQKAIRKIFKEAGVDIYFISAQNGQGVSELMVVVDNFIKEQFYKETPMLTSEIKILRPLEKKADLITLEDGIYIINSPNLERFVRGTDTQDAEGRRQLRMLIMRRHILDALAAAGAVEGDTVRCASFSFRL